MRMKADDAQLLLNSVGSTIKKSLRSSDIADVPNKNSKEFKEGVAYAIDIIDAQRQIIIDNTKVMKDLGISML